MKRKYYWFHVLILLTLLLSLSPSLQKKVYAQTEEDRSVVLSLPFIVNGFANGRGSVEGEVRDIDTGEALEKASVCYLSQCVQTDSRGRYRLEGLPTGGQGVKVTLAPYLPKSLRGIILKDKTIRLNFGLHSISINGSVSGRVLSGVTGSGLENASVCFEDTCTLSDGDGTYLLGPLPVKSITLQASRNPFTTQTVTTTIPEGGTATRDIVLPFKPGERTRDYGTIVGTVTSLSSGVLLSNASVCYLNDCARTDSQGKYTLAPVPAGSKNIVAVQATYEEKSQTVLVPKGKQVTANFGLTTNLSARNLYMQARLSWSPVKAWSPRGTKSAPLPCDAGEAGCIENDLDAQFWIKARDFHYLEPYARPGDCTVYPQACFDIWGDLNSANVSQGSGPEALLVVELKVGAVYHFAVLNYNDAEPFVAPLTKSQAIVEVDSASGLHQVFHVPTSGSGDLWYVFSMDEAGQITETNCITSLGLADENGIPPVPSCTPPTQKGNLRPARN